MYKITIRNPSDQIIESEIFNDLKTAKKFGLRWADTFDQIEIRYTENNNHILIVADRFTNFHFIEV